MKQSEQVRGEVRKCFETAIRNHPKLCDRPDYVLFNIAHAMETACHNAAVIECEANHIECTYVSKGFLSRYSSLCDKYARNLDTKSSLESDEFGNMIASGQVDIDAICDLSSRDINPLASQSDHTEIKIRSEQKSESKFTKRYPCPACGARRATYDEVQRAAVDEPSHNRITCLECKNVWMKRGI